MGRRKCRRWNSCLVWFLTSVGALFYTINSISATTDTLYREEGVADEPSSCPASRTLSEEKFLMIVSTLDGKVSALDVKNNGELLWSYHADTHPLLSSSISKLEITRNGMRTRLIPSLDGGLYQYDGEGIEAIPMTAESLLRSTSILSDRTMMVGGKDVKSYGINPATGELQYMCSSENCKVFGDAEDVEGVDMLVVTRSTQTVRALDARNGLERWNFSVGEHQMELLKGAKVIQKEADTEEDVSVQSCPINDDDDDDEIDNGVCDENSLKIIVPEGMVVGLSPENSDVVLWNYKFPSPIANAWLLQKGSLSPISVFDNKHVPALSSFLPSDEKVAPEPLLYVGMHQNQLYVQPSMSMKEYVASAARSRPPLNVPRVAWKPYLNSAPSRTPILRGNRRGAVPMITDGSGDKDDRSLTVWHENYPFDNGYYLYPDVSLPINYSNGEHIRHSVVFESIYTPLWYYWKEVTALSLLMSLGLNLLLRRCKKLYKRRMEGESSLEGSVKNDESSASVNSVEEKKADEYSSRYEADFLQVQCLGKGGFGIVFEAVNRVDECSYAIKRISLPKSESAKDRVMREVRALAKLHHNGIVRYFNAWWESPPQGWQESKDRQLEECESISMPSPCQTVTHNGTRTFSEKFDVKDPTETFSEKFDLQNPFGGANSNEVYGLNYNKRAGGSTEFSVTKSTSFDISKSESFQFGNLNENTINEDDESLDVEFRLDDSDDSGSCSNNIPFSTKSRLNQDTNNSFSIVFEDSGCADKSSHSSSGGIVFVENSRNKSTQNTESSERDKYIIDISSSVDHQASSNINTSHSKQMERSGKNMPMPKLYLFIQMQLCRRDTLKDWLGANSDIRDNYVVLDIFDQIVSAVEYVHDCGLMHRDLKPSNIFFSLDGTVKIGDFGLVTALTEEEREQCTIDGNPYKRHTAQVGTTLYMSPEQVNGKSYGHKVDIFSLGMILFELLFPFSTQMERVRTMMDVKKGIFPKSFCKDEKKYVAWLLSLDPCTRPTAKEIINSPLLKDFQHRHILSQTRTRTTSSSSSSGSLS